VIATTGLTHEQEPHIHGSKTKKSGSVDGKYYNQSSAINETDPNTLFSQVLKEVCLSQHKLINLYTDTLPISK
jgi:tRNA U34 5-methylaminomethyl-2-thiouridine-forming methyltransferase MnmC